MTSITLALSGGAARGAYHLGVLEYIDHHDICVEAICGTSIGAIIAASYFSGVTPKEQLEIIKSKAFREIFSFHYFKGSLFQIEGNHELLTRWIPTKNLEDLNKPLYLTAVDLYSGKNLYFDHGDIKTLCMASSALIPFFPPVSYQEYRLVDGGVKDHMPMQPLKQYYYPIVGVNLHPLLPNDGKQTLWSTAKRALFLSIYGHSVEAKNICDFYISSDELAKYSLFSFKHFDELFTMGYHEAEKVLDTIVE
ncbi:patatin-like phospholipase family protein [Sulfurospirillum sp. 1612]|uniref:patatin-like phospholipase family protein n=1 Tax=Sulfurospirillum sp. 1612 TaxID=3094835 RepID=UPI002F958B37